MPTTNQLLFNGKTYIYTGKRYIKIKIANTGNSKVIVFSGNQPYQNEDSIQHNGDGLHVHLQGADVCDAAVLCIYYVPGTECLCLSMWTTESKMCIRPMNRHH